MRIGQSIDRPSSVGNRKEPVLFSETETWRSVGSGWQQLHGSFVNLGVSFEWHDFQSAEAIDWAKSFHPGSIEICLNLAGRGRISCRSKTVEYQPLDAGFYCHGPGSMEAVRYANEQHQFITVEFAPAFLRQHLQGQENALHPLVKEVVVKDKAVSGVTLPVRLNSRQQQLVSSLRQPPVMRVAQDLWYQSKALELIVEFFFHTQDDSDLFCVRQQRVARERVEKVMELLRKNCAEPPTLEEIGKQVGCSPFYLSRTFSKETGTTIPQYLRQLRMEKAARLLKSGKYNVTEAALEVGYSSLSHFSVAFHQTFGCCPGLYSTMPNHLVHPKQLDRSTKK